MNIFEMPVIGHEGMVNKIFNRLPRTKRKRIVKKWQKYKYNTEPRKDALIYACGIVCHPTMVEKVQQGIEVARSHQNGSKTEEETNHGTISEGKGSKIPTMDSPENS